MTEREIDADRAIIAKATRGPWEAYNDDGLIGIQSPVRSLAIDFEPRDAEFCAAARSRWPAALDREQALRDAIWDDWTSFGGRNYEGAKTPRSEQMILNWYSDVRPPLFVATVCERLAAKAEEKR